MDWQTLLGPEKEKAYFKQLLKQIQDLRASGINVYPESEEVFNAFALTPFDKIKVVIIGQDPYHGAGQAHGLCFSVKTGVKIPPSLRNIYKELCTSIDQFSMPKHGNLEAWAKQGVLLLNTVLTVEEGQANSHKKLGWQQFTDTVIKQVSTHANGIVFLLWGKPAQQKIKLIDERKHHILCSVHPSPLSAHRGFLGCQHFVKTNEHLLAQNKQAIEWQVD